MTVKNLITNNCYFYIIHLPIYLLYNLLTPPSLSLAPDGTVSLAGSQVALTNWVKSSESRAGEAKEYKTALRGI